MDLSPLWISLKTSLVATIITFFFGIAFAWLVCKYRGRFKGLIDGVLSLPMILPPTVVGFFLLLIFGRNGPVGSFLTSLGYQIIFSWPATVVAALIIAFPLMYRTAKGAFEQVDGNLINAARTLGASEWKVFWKVAVPVAWPGIAAGTVLTFARSLGEFGATLMIAGNIPGETQTIPVAIFFAVEGGDMNTAYIWVGIILSISIGVMTLMNKWTGKNGGLWN